MHLQIYSGRSPFFHKMYEVDMFLGVKCVLMISQQGYCSSWCPLFPVSHFETYQLLACTHIPMMQDGTGVAISLSHSILSAYFWHCNALCSFIFILWLLLTYRVLLSLADGCRSNCRNWACTWSETRKATYTCSYATCICMVIAAVVRYAKGP